MYKFGQAFFYTMQQQWLNDKTMFYKAKHQQHRNSAPCRHLRVVSLHLCLEKIFIPYIFLKSFLIKCPVIFKNEILI
uniref:Uncharacterized protein n=1 Tax=Anguilla anguilla TaxID=7936 RepID=A0A0E9XG85_ANGAN